MRAINNIRMKYKTIISAILIILYSIALFFGYYYEYALSYIALIIPLIVVIIWFIVLLLNIRKGVAGAKFNLKLTGILALITVMPPIGSAITGSNIIGKILGPDEDVISQDLEDLTTKLQYIDYKETTINVTEEINQFVMIIKDNPEYMTNGTIPKIYEHQIPNGIDFIILFKFESGELIDSGNQTLLISEDIIGEKLNYIRDFVDIFEEFLIFQIRFEGTRMVDNYKFENLNDLKISIMKTFPDKNFFILGGTYSQVSEEIIIERSKMIILEESVSKLNQIVSSINYQVSTIKDRFLLFTLYLSLPIILIVIIVSFFIARQFTKPLSELVKGTKFIATGNYNYHIKAKATDEMGQLIWSFNAMADELNRNKNQLYQAQRIAAWREVARRLAHEVKNPLTPIKLAAERVMRRWDREKDMEKFGNVLSSCMITIISETDRLRDMVNEFSQFAKLPAPSMDKENILEVIQETIKFYDQSREEIKFKLNNRLEDSDKFLYADKKQFRQVLINLFENSIDACNEAGIPITRLAVTIDTFWKIKSKWFRLTVKDNGPGVSSDIIDEIFAPYYSTKGGKGTGLGLSIVKSIIGAHEGNIFCENNESGGATFIIEIPYERYDNEKRSDN